MMGRDNTRKTATRASAAERGNIVVIAMISMASVLSLAGLAMLGVRGGLRVSGHDRFRAIALYAAESGIAVGKQYLRTQYTGGDNWNSIVSAQNETPAVPASSELAGNDEHHRLSDGTDNPDNPFDSALQARYKVTILNNISDSGYGLGTDDDGIVMLRSEGFGPNGAYAVIEVEVGTGPSGGAEFHCDGYAQKNIAATGSGFNPCLTLSGTSMTTFKPGK